MIKITDEQFAEAMARANEDQIKLLKKAAKKDEISIDDLYFGVMAPKPGYSSQMQNTLEPRNLFSCSRVLLSVAMWVVSDNKFKKEHDFLGWCFSDVWGRAEYEFIVSPWPPIDGVADPRGEKMDLYRMYVAPNEGVLRELVDRVSIKSAKKYLTEERRRYRR